MGTGLDINNLTPDAELFATADEPAPIAKPKPEAPEVENLGGLSLAIADVLDGEGHEFLKLRLLEKLVARVLPEIGKLIRSDDGMLYLLRADTHTLESLDSLSCKHYLAKLTGLSTIEKTHKFVVDRLKTLALETEALPVRVRGYFDRETGQLAVSFGGGVVWRWNGEHWSKCYNGENGLLFYNAASDVYCEPDFDVPDRLDWLFNTLTVVDSAPGLDGNDTLSRSDQVALLRIWLLSIFLPEVVLHPPIPCMTGQADACKTTNNRLFGKLLTGPGFEARSVTKDGEKDFNLAITNSTIVAFQNVDTYYQWLEDALARTATGVKHETKELYTTADTRTLVPRGAVLIDSRNPHFRREDVSQRLLLMYCETPKLRIGDSRLQSELVARRPGMLGALLRELGNAANIVVKNEPAPPMGFRMLDYAEFGWRVFNEQARGDEWVGIINRARGEQVAFVTNDDPVVEFISIFVAEMSGTAEVKGVIGPVSTGILFKRYNELAPHNGWPFFKDGRGWGSRLKNMKREIEKALKFTIAVSTGHARATLWTIHTQDYVPPVPSPTSTAPTQKGRQRRSRIN